LDLFWTYMTSLVSLNLFCFSIIQILAWFSFFYGILLIALSCWDHISCFYVVSLSANDLSLVRSLPFLSVGCVACLGPEAVSWFVCWSNFSKLKLWFIIIVSCKPVTQHIQDWLSKRIEKRNYLLEKLWDDDLVHVALWKRWGACH